MRTIRFRTVQLYMVGVVLAVALPLAAAMFFIWWQALQEGRALAVELLKTNVRQVRHDLQQFATEAELILFRMSERPAIRRLSAAACDAEMDLLGEFHNAFLAVTLWDRSGRIVCTSIATKAGVPVPRPHRASFEAGLAVDGLYVSDVFLGQITGLPLVALTYPVKDEAGAVVGLLSIPVRMGYFDRLLLELGHRAGSSAAIVDRAGTYVSRVADAKRWRGHPAANVPVVRAALGANEGLVTAKGPDDMERSYVFLRIPGFGWHVMFGISSTRLYEGFYRQLIGGGAIFLAVFAASLAFAFFLARRITMPFTELGAVVADVAAGDHSRRAKISGTNDFARTAADLNAMLDTLDAEAAERRLSEANLAAAQRITHLGSWELDLGDVQDLNRNPLRWSDETFRIFGYEPGAIEVSRTAFLNAVHPDDRDRIEHSLAEAIRDGTAYRVDHRILRPDGSVRVVRESSEIAHDEARGIRMMVGTVLDITEQKQAEELLVATRDRLQALSGRLLGAQEEERRRIARELHDQIGQELTSLKIQLDMLAHAAASPEQRALIIETAAAAGETLQRVRRISMDLRPPQLDALGLTAALRAHIERQSSLGRTKLHFDAGDLPRRLPGELEIACFRMVQEALTNVLRHADASNAWVELGAAGDTLRVEVRDDGRGFDADHVLLRGADSGGTGLLGVRERVLLAGGMLDIRSRPGQGCTMTVTFPIPDSGANG